VLCLLVSSFLDAEEGREEAMKPSHLEVSQSIPLTFELVAQAVSASSWTNSLCCTSCRVPLNLHQPDEERPSQLLGTCDACSRWFFVVESEMDWEGMLLFELPTAETIRAMLAVAAAH
jgi:hypothetical protein